MASPRRRLKDLQIRPRKSFGQHFLHDPNILRKIVAQASLTPEDVVVEIGAGLGDLTALLAEKARRVYALEIDPRLGRVLEDRFPEGERVEVILDDALKFDFGPLFRKWGRKIKVVANLPYEISSPMIFRFFEERKFFSLLLLMLQLEVARRIVSPGPGDKEYGPLSLWARLYTRAAILFQVPPHVFHPPPKVESAVVRFEILASPTLEVKDEQTLQQVIRSAFGYRRKTLPNALQSGAFSRFSRPEILQILEACRISPKARGESLTLEQFRDLADSLYGKN